MQLDQFVRFQRTSVQVFRYSHMADATVYRLPRRLDYASSHHFRHITAHGLARLQKDAIGEDIVARATS